MIYLDWAASAPMRPEALEALCRFAREDYANPGGLHAASGRARAVIQRSRRTLAGLLGVPDSGLLFCSGGTESNNWAVRCGAGERGGHLLIGACEHKSVLESARQMKRRGFDVTLLRPDAHGRIDPAAAEAALRPDTRLISVQAANNETGTIQDIAALAELAGRHGVRFHCDAVQCFGHAALPLNRADLITVTAHKLGGPRGIGCLAVSRGLPPPPRGRMPSTAPARRSSSRWPCASGPPAARTPRPRNCTEGSPRPAWSRRPPLSSACRAGSDGGISS